MGQTRTDPPRGPTVQQRWLKKLLFAGLTSSLPGASSNHKFPGWQGLSSLKAPQGWCVSRESGKSRA